MVYIMCIQPYECEKKRAAAIGPRGGAALGSKHFHYMGHAKNLKALEERFKLHRSGKGSKILAAANRLGLKWEVVAVFKLATENEERRVKSVWKNIPRLCPYCNPKAKTANVFDNRRCKISPLAMWENYFEDKNLTPRFFGRKK